MATNKTMINNNKKNTMATNKNNEKCLKQHLFSSTFPATPVLPLAHHYKKNDMKCQHRTPYMGILPWFQCYDSAEVLFRPSEGAGQGRTSSCQRRWDVSSRWESASFSWFLVPREGRPGAVAASEHFRWFRVFLFFLLRKNVKIYSRLRA